MVDIFRRLTLLIMVISFLGFGGSWIYCKKEYSKWNEWAEINGTLLEKYRANCENKNEQCIQKGLAENEFMTAIEFRDSYKKKVKVYELAMFLAPFSFLFLYLAYGWVTTGKI